MLIVIQKCDIATSFLFIELHAQDCCTCHNMTIQITKNEISLKQYKQIVSKSTLLNTLIESHNQKKYNKN